MLIPQESSLLEQRPELRWWKAPATDNRSAMIRLASFIVIALGAVGLARADELPATLDKPYLGCWLAFSDSRDFEFVIGGDGDAELFFIKNRKRLSVGGCTLKIYYVLEEKIKGNGGKMRWISRKMIQDGFENFGKETAEPPLRKPIGFTASFTGGVKVRITKVFTKDGMEISTQVIDKGASKGELRAGVKILVGDLFRQIDDADLEKRETESKLEDTEISVRAVGARRTARVKFEDYDVVLTEKFPKGVRAFALESDRYGDHEFQITTANPEFGVIEFLQRKKIIHGFYVNWYPDPDKAGEQDARLLFKVK
ncbi:MAG: hypothetical protein CMN02_11905 [Roseibacillus sp.]|nr:hypothetical protein [Roseibacillus sp.]